MKEPIFLPLDRLANAEPDAALFERVLRGIYRAKLFQLRVRLALIASGLLLSIGSVALYWSSLWQELSASSFFEFIRLAVSDPDIVLRDVQGFVSGILETLPITVLLLLCTGCFFLLASVVLVHAWRKTTRVPFFSPHTSP